MLQYSIRALKAIPKFFSYRNDVDIFTEDKVADKEFYKTLFSKLFGNQIVINDVTPLGCKNNVLESYDNQVNDSRRKYYIVDGDLDLLTGTNRSSEKNLIVLDSYCIENYLIDEVGAIELIYFSSGSESRDNLKNKLNFNRWLNYNSDCLIELFLNFAVLKHCGGGPVLKNANVFLRTEGKQTILNKEKVIDYIVEIKSEIISRYVLANILDPEGKYQSEMLLMREKWPNSTQTLLQIVSAKNYLLPLLQHRVNHCISKGKALIPNASIKLFLANNSSLERLTFIKAIIK